MMSLEYAILGFLNYLPLLGLRPEEDVRYFRPTFLARPTKARSTAPWPN